MTPGRGLCRNSAFLPRLKFCIGQAGTVFQIPSDKERRKRACCLYFRVLQKGCAPDSPHTGQLCGEGRGAVLAFPHDGGRASAGAHSACSRSHTADGRGLLQKRRRAVHEAALGCGFTPELWPGRAFPRGAAQKKDACRSARMGEDCGASGAPCRPASRPR